MGMSATAHVFWGYDLGNLRDEDGEPVAPAWMCTPDVDDEEHTVIDASHWQDWLGRRLGWNEVPFFPQPAGVERAEWRMTQEYQAWCSSRDERDELLRGIGAELECYGHCDDSEQRFQVVLNESVVEGDCWESNPLRLPAGDDWLGRVLRFMELLELRIPDEDPTWLVTCSYG